jgi:hypothetical protein
LPGDPSNDITLSATSAFGGIDVTWAYPTTNPHAVAYVKVFRGTSSDISTAIKVGEVGGNFFFDKLEAVTTCFYWIQVISINGTVLDAVGPVSATSKLTITGLMQQLTGIIDDGLLATTLKNKLDQISILNANLANEILDREGGETTLAAALADVEVGIAQAHTFILNETNSRVTQNSAIVEQINGIVATIGDDVGSVITTMQVQIENLQTDLSGFGTTVSSLGTSVSGFGTQLGTANSTINAMIVTKLTVNGLVGGFGLVNDSFTVEAGFDVDTFWVGRTNANKIKPFIITGDVVYISEAVIPILSADKIDTNGLKIRNGDGQVIFGAGATVDPSVFMAVPNGWLNSVAIATAAADATAKSNAARDTAIAAANDASDLALVTANAYADGIVSLEESRAILDATNKANASREAAVLAAALDATTKANAAQAAAAVDAAAKANAAIAAAAVDATNKTNAVLTLATEELATKLDKNASDTLSGVLTLNTATASGLRVGNIVWNTAGERTSGFGIAVTPLGIVSFNPTGAPTFSINALTGDVQVRGDISGSTGNFVGSISVNGASFVNNVPGLFAGIHAGNPVMRVGNATKGFVWDGTDFNILGNIVVSGNLAAGSVTDSKLGLSAFNAVIPGGDLIVPDIQAGHHSYGLRSVVVSGGTAPYSYFWSVTATGHVYKSIGTLGSATTSEIEIAGSAVGSTVSGVLICLVKDANGRSTFATCFVQATHQNDGGGGGGGEGPE